MIESGRSAAALLPPVFSARHFVKSPMTNAYFLLEKWGDSMVIGNSLAKWRNLEIWSVVDKSKSSHGVCIVPEVRAVVECGGYCLMVDETLSKLSIHDDLKTITVMRGPNGTAILNNILSKDWKQLIEKFEVI